VAVGAVDDEETSRRVPVEEPFWLDTVLVLAAGLEL
jgi:hypothetical protein